MTDGIAKTVGALSCCICSDILARLRQEPVIWTWRIAKLRPWCTRLCRPHVHILWARAHRRVVEIIRASVEAPEKVYGIGHLWAQGHTPARPEWISTARRKSMGLFESFAAVAC